MAFYDYDLTEQVKGKHELSKIEEVVGFSGLVYRFKDLANSVGRQGWWKLASRHYIWNFTMIYQIENWKNVFDLTLLSNGFVDLPRSEKPPIIAFLDDFERLWEQNG